MSKQLSRHIKKDHIMKSTQIFSTYSNTLNMLHYIARVQTEERTTLERAYVVLAGHALKVLADRTTALGMSLNLSSVLKRKGPAGVRAMNFNDIAEFWLIEIIELLKEDDKKIATM
jgi:hypothetical protein